MFLKLFFLLFPVPDAGSGWNQRETNSNFSKIRMVTSFADISQYFYIECIELHSEGSSAEVFVRP